MRIHRHWSAEDIAKLTLMTKQGHYLSEIARALNRTESSVQTKAYDMRLRIDTPTKKVEWTEEEKVTLVAMRKTGVSYLTIAKHLGRSRKSTIGAAHRLGLSMPVSKAEVRVFVPKQVAKKTEYVAPDGQRANLYRFDMARIPDISKYMLKGSNPKPLVERQFGECCFPVAGDSDGTLYCCEPVVREKKYCKRHYRVMYVMRT